MADLAARERFDTGDDERIAGLLSRAAARLEPDPLFRRRLRGEVLNTHVALHEGVISPHRSRGMGRLGRSALLACLTLAVSVSAAGAAAQSSLPGELLYPVKLQLEAIRLQLATGAAHDDLLSMALSERLDELERLAQAGEWTLVASAAQAASDAERAVRRTGRPADPAQQTRLHGRIARLEALLVTAPTRDRGGLRRALRVATERAASTPKPNSATPNGGTVTSTNNARAGRSAEPTATSNAGGNRPPTAGRPSKEQPASHATAD